MSCVCQHPSPTSPNTPHSHQALPFSQNHRHFICATLGSHWISTRPPPIPSQIHLLQYHSVILLQLHPRTCIPKHPIPASQLKYPTPYQAMPRDLTELAKNDAISSMSPLDRTSKPDSDSEQQQQPDKPRQGTMFAEQAQKNSKRDDLHPYTQTLTLNDVESCVILEEAAFPPQERATREKFQYRLGKCSELSLGIYTSHEGNDIPTAATASPVYTGAPQRKSVLLGHIVATMTTGLTVTDKDMGIPSDDPNDHSLGHKSHGRTVAIHSLAVLPDFQRKGLGSTLMKAYLDRLAKQDVADKAALIAHEEMIPYYETFGFKNRGKSSAQFGGGGWFDMVKDITDDSDDY